MNFRKMMLGCALALGLAASALAAPFTVKVIGFNDFHGNLQSPGTFATDATGLVKHASGGADYVAAYIAWLKSQNPNTVVVHAGDMVGASPLVSAFFHDEGAIEAMSLAGVDIASVGNHEFDAGRAELLRKQSGGCYPSGVNTCLINTPFAGARFKYLSANVTDSTTGKTLFPAYQIKTFNGVRVAFIGMTLKDTPTIVTPTGVAGLNFADEANTVNALIPVLRSRGVNAIIVVIHQGGVQGTVVAPATNFINDCAGNLQNTVASPILDVVSRLNDGVDLVVSGHSHTAYNCLLPNSAGRAIPVTQASAFGRVLSNIDVTLESTTGKVTGVSAQNLVVDQVTANTPGNPVNPFLSAANVTQVSSLIGAYAAATSPLAAQVIGTITAGLTNVASASGEQPAGDLIADSQLSATAPASLGGAVVAFMNPGGVRSPGFTAAVYPHDVTYGEAFTVQPFGNSLVTLTLTAQNIKDVLEQQFAGCNGQTANRVLQVSNGFHSEWSLSAPACSKVLTVTLQSPANSGAVDTIVSGGVVQNPTKTYRVTVNNFLATGGDNFRVLTQGTNQLGGPQDIDAMVAYMTATYKAPNAPYDPTNPLLNLPRTVQLP